MLSTSTMLPVLFLSLLLHEHFAQAEPIRQYKAEQPNIESNITENELITCKDQLSKYRQFILQAIVGFEDVCDTPQPSALRATTHDNVFRIMPHQLRAEGVNIFRNYQKAAARSDTWAFFKLLMAQFNDAEFANVIRDAVIERCRIKAQHDMKRNSAVLGKKQRFHSWGGKRTVPYDFNDGYDGSNGAYLTGYFL